MKHSNMLNTKIVTNNRLNRAIGRYVPILVMLLILTSIPYLLDSAYAEKKIPKDKADLKEPHGKVRIIEYEGLRAIAIPLYTTVDNPSNHIVSPGGNLDGVAKIILTRTDGIFLCSGGLLTTGMHVLTAAHCVTDDFGNFNLVSSTVTFEGDFGTETLNVDVANSAVHPKYDGDFIKGNDIAVLKLVTTASVDITRYDIDRNSSDDVGTIADDKSGYGMSGTGNTGATFFDGNKRTGQNLYDDVADTMLKALGLKPKKDFVRGSVLQYDFDNGIPANDAFGFFFGKSDLGLGTAEVSSALGDSGGPSQQAGVITGVTSYGITLTFVGGATSDVTPGVVDSSFGEFSGDTRVSKYADFIDGITGGVTPPPDTTLPTLQAISVTPTDTSIPVGSAQQYTATGSFSDGSTADITNQVTWVSSNSLVATIDAAGLASAASEGTTTISATSEAVVGSTTLTVTTQASDIVEITKAEYRIRNGDLRVQATSTDPSATLTVVGYGEMKNKGDGTYQFRLRDAIDPGDTITVTSLSGGSATAPVKHR